MINKLDARNALHGMLERAAFIGLFGLASAVGVALVAGLVWLVNNQFLIGISVCVALALILWFFIELHLARSRRKMTEWCAQRAEVLKNRKAK